MKANGTEIVRSEGGLLRLACFAAVFAFVGLVGCARDRANPLDKQNLRYQDPGVKNVKGVETGDTLTGDSLVVTLSGNPSGTQYRFKLDSLSWTEWNTSGVFKDSLLDEGDHELLVETKYASGAVSDDPETLSFYTDAITGPALLLRKRRTAAEIGDTISIEVVLEEVTDVAIVNAVVDYDTLALALVDVGSKNSFEQLLFAYKEKTLGKLEISAGWSPSQGNGFDGTEAFADMKFVVKRYSRISLESSSVIMDNTRTVMPLTATRGAFVFLK